MLVKCHDTISSFSIILPTKHIFKGKILHSELLDNSNPLRIVNNIVHFETFTSFYQTHLVRGYNADIAQKTRYALQ